MKNEIKSSKQNEIIISEMLKIEIKKAMNKKNNYAYDLIEGLK